MLRSSTPDRLMRTSSILTWMSLDLMQVKDAFQGFDFDIVGVSAGSDSLSRLEQ